MTVGAAPAVVETLLFDLDGTLADPAEGFTRCVADALEVVGLPAVSNDRLEACIGPPLHDTFRNLGAAPEQVDALVEAYRARYRESGIFENQLYAGIVGALAVLRERGHTLHLATSKPKVFAEIILEHFGIRSLFTHVFGSNLDRSLAHKRDLLLHARGQADLDFAHCAMIGDRRFDMEPARELGLLAVGVCWGYGSREELANSGAALLVDRPADLPRLLSHSEAGNSNPADSPTPTARP
jgi:phosphoglycolate phosphatase